MNENNTSQQLLYHIYPEDFRGPKLMPLNLLRNQFPDLYEEEIKKYQGREHLTKRVVPLLQCLWNDVVHSTNIHPNNFFLAMQAAGRKPKPDLLWMKIPIKYAILNPTIVYSCRTTIENPINVPENEFSWFDIEKFETSHLDMRTQEYYKKKSEMGERIFSFQGVAHFLIQGEIDLADCELIHWNVGPNNK